jgi:hypothetical protein
MASEAMPRVGEVSIADVRAALGTAFDISGHVDVAVIDPEGGVPVSAHVELGQLEAGRGRHRAFLCPGCRTPVRVLRARRGTLRCRKCHGYLTRRQLEHHTAAWNRLGGADEDRLLRLLRGARRLTPTRLELARQIAHGLAAADADRLRELQERLHDLRVCIEQAAA